MAVDGQDPLHVTRFDAMQASKHKSRGLRCTEASRHPVSVKEGMKSNVHVRVPRHRSTRLGCAEAQSPDTGACGLAVLKLTHGGDGIQCRCAGVQTREQVAQLH
eukprot:1154081-Pelagomonas_calceolata.AAC.10